MTMARAEGAASARAWAARWRSLEFSVQKRELILHFAVGGFQALQPALHDPAADRQVASLEGRHAHCHSKARRLSRGQNGCRLQ